MIIFLFHFKSRRGIYLLARADPVSPPLSGIFERRRRQKRGKGQRKHHFSGGRRIKHLYAPSVLIFLPVLCPEPNRPHSGFAPGRMGREERGGERKSINDTDRPLRSAGKQRERASINSDFISTPLPPISHEKEGRKRAASAFLCKIYVPFSAIIKFYITGGRRVNYCCDFYYLLFPFSSVLFLGDRVKSVTPNHHTFAV